MQFLDFEKPESLISCVTCRNISIFIRNSAVICRKREFLSFLWNFRKIWVSDLKDGFSDIYVDHSASKSNYTFSCGHGRLLNGISWKLAPVSEFLAENAEILIFSDETRYEAVLRHEKANPYVSKMTLKFLKDKDVAEWIMVRIIEF